jgi:serine/threonine protein kinase
MALMPRPRRTPRPDRSDPPELQVRVPSPSTLRPRAPGGDPGWRPTIAPGRSSATTRPDDLDALLEEFAGRWRRGVRVRAEDYLDRLRGRDPSDAIELIYHEFCLAEADGLEPDPDAYLERFPAHRDRLTRLFGLHGGLTPAQLGLWIEPEELPRSGDEIGPYRLLRELGRGAFARVFLAEQADLDDRLVVLKIATRATPEPRLLGRVRHPHIVEVLDHGPTGDGSLHLLGMPFLGGATLSDVLAALPTSSARRRGADLLAALDRAAAPEYRATMACPPARGQIAAGSYPRAIAWIVARLAEAIEHAHRRGVSHGDLKPSNVLLTAAGTPMLFDFNLALDWRARDEIDALTDRGGTLAYMAPERLAALASPDEAAPPSAASRHRADIYGLGLILAEALGAGPLPTPGADATAGVASLRELATRWASRRGAEDGPGFRELCDRAPAALRPILARCLAPNPADRYSRAGELAEDLDRFRDDRAPLHAQPPGWTTELSRWSRRHRRAWTAAVLVLAVGLVTTAAVARSFRTTLTQLAQARLSHAWDGPSGDGIFPLGRPGPIRGTPGLETNLTNLQTYGILETPDWRDRDDVRSLPEAERGDLEAWLLEQAYRYARAVAGQPEAPTSWRRRAALALAHTAGSWRAPDPIASLLARFPGDTPVRTSDAAAPDLPGWIADYIIGVAADMDDDFPRARAAYGRSLDARPEAFWPRYRAAVASWRLGDFPAAAADLERVSAARPANARLHIGLAGLYLKLDRPSDALDAANRALTIVPDLDEAWHSRLLARAALGQSAELTADLAELGRLARLNDQPHAWILFTNATGQFGRASPRPDAALGPRLSTLSGELDVRQSLVGHWIDRGEIARAEAEINQILDRDPGYLPARYTRIQLERARDRDPDHAHALAQRLTREEGLSSWLARQPDLLRLHRYLASDLIRQDRTGEACDQLRQALAQLTTAHPEPSPLRRRIEGELHYSLARALAASSLVEAYGDEPEEARIHLARARRLIPAEVAAWAKADWLIQSLDPADSTRE